MNDDLIRRGELLEKITKAQNMLRTSSDPIWEINQKYFKGLAWANRLVLDEPAVDAVEVVRCEKCGNCKTIFPEKRIDQEPTQVLFCEIYRCNRKPDEFCSDGDRRNDDG